MIDFLIFAALLLLIADRIQSRKDKAKASGGTFISPGGGGGGDSGRIHHK